MQILLLVIVPIVFLAGFCVGATSLLILTKFLLKNNVIKQFRSLQSSIPEAPIEENSVTYLNDEHEMKIEKANATTN